MVDTSLILAVSQVCSSPALRMLFVHNECYMAGQALG